MEQEVSTSNSSDSKEESKIISTGHESRPTTGQENKQGILKSIVMNQTNTGQKSSTNNQSQQLVQWSKVQLHYFTNGDRQRYILMLCGDCGYETTSSLSLDKHIKEKHFVALETPATKKDEFKFRCAHCPYKARLKRSFEQHSTCHRNQAAKYQCPLCSFSVDNIGHLNRHLKLHSGETGEDENFHNAGVHPQNAENGGEKLPILSNNTNNTGSESRMLKVSLQPTDPGHDESSIIRQVEQETLKSPIINENTNGKSSSIQTYSPPNKWKDQRFSFGQRKRYKCGDCDYHTSSKVSMDLHVELMHPISAITSLQLVTTTTEGETSEEIGDDDTCNNDRQNADIDDRIASVLSKNNRTEFEALMRKKFGIIKECRVTLHDIYYSSAKVMNPENMELLPIEEDDKIADVELEADEKIQSLRSRIMVIEEKSRIAEEEVTQILSKKTDVHKRISEMAGRRQVIEYDLRLERCSVLEMIISAHDTAGDERGLVEPAEAKVKILEKKLDLMDGKLDVLKQEEASLAQKLVHAQDSHVGIVRVLEALQSEMDGLYYC